MKHLHNFEKHNESLKDYLVAGTIAASTAFSSPKEVKASQTQKIEVNQAQDVKVEFVELDSVSFQHSNPGIYNIRKSSNVENVVVGKQKVNPQYLVEKNEIKFIVKIKIKENQYPYDIKVVNKKMEYQPGWGMNEEFPKMYFLPISFEEDEERQEEFVFLEISIKDLKEGNYSFNVAGNVIKFEVN
jgi:hypothetical protein